MMNYMISKTENGVLHDTVQRLHCGSPYFQSSRQLYNIKRTNEMQLWAVLFL